MFDIVDATFLPVLENKQFVAVKQPNSEQPKAEDSAEGSEDELP